MDTARGIQILIETLRKSMHLTILPPAFCK